MTVNTKLFGNIDIEESKIITFESGLMGFEEFKQYTIIYDTENSDTTILWLQSIEKAELAFPVIDPSNVYGEYNPTIEDELLKPLGEMKEEDLYALVILTVPAEIKNITANLKAPLIINSATGKGAQLIVDDEKYIIKYNVYNYIENLKKKGEK